VKKVFIVLLILAVLIVLFVNLPIANPKMEIQEPLVPFLEELCIPEGFDGQIVEHCGFTLCYSEEDEQPYWVAYVLTPQETVISKVQRQDNFREDPMISTKSAVLKDYKGSGYDRGHLIPFADLSWSEQSGSDSFYLSNMSPQVAALNRGRWQELESVVRTFSLEGPVCVVTGPVLTDGPFMTIGESKVSVPNYYYKVILDYCEPGFKAIGFVLPNSDCPKDLKDYAVSVDEVERLTGLDFFSLLDDTTEDALESSFDTSLWNFTSYSKKLAVTYGLDPDTARLEDSLTLYLKTDKAISESFSDKVLCFLFSVQSTIKRSLAYFRLF